MWCFEFLSCLSLNDELRSGIKSLVSLFLSPLGYFLIGHFITAMQDPGVLGSLIVLKSIYKVSVVDFFFLFAVTR